MQNTDFSSKMQQIARKAAPGWKTKKTFTKIYTLLYITNELWWAIAAMDLYCNELDWFEANSRGNQCFCQTIYIYFYNHILYVYIISGPCSLHSILGNKSTSCCDIQHGLLIIRNFLLMLSTYIHGNMESHWNQSLGTAQRRAIISSTNII
jgi:hypothetical protein